MVLDGCPGLNKRKVMRLVAGQLPGCRVIEPIDTDSVLLHRGLLECRNPCCFEHFQNSFLQRRLQRDLSLAPRPGVTLQVRDTVSCASFFDPFMDLVTTAKLPRKGRIYSKAIVPKWDANFNDQIAAERQVKKHRALARRLNCLLRTDKRSVSIDLFLKQHEANRRKDLAPAAEAFIKALDLVQLKEASLAPHRIIRHYPDDPAFAASSIVSVIKRECQKMKIPLSLPATPAVDNSA